MLKDRDSTEDWKLGAGQSQIPSVTFFDIIPSKMHISRGWPKYLRRVLDLAWCTMRVFTPSSPPPPIMAAFSLFTKRGRHNPLKHARSFTCCYCIAALHEASKWAFPALRVTTAASAWSKSYGQDWGCYVFLQALSWTRAQNAAYVHLIFVLVYTNVILHAMLRIYSSKLRAEWKLYNKF